MPSISGPRSAPVVKSTSTTQPKPATAAQPQARAAEGYGTSSSFATAASAPSSTPKTISDALAQLDRFPAGADRDTVSKVLNTPFPTPEDLKAASDALGRLGDNAPSDMTEDDYKQLANGLGYKQNQNTMMSMITSNMQKMIEEIKKRGEKKD